MTKRLYYHDSFANQFDAQVVEVRAENRPAVILNQTAFYPTSGGQTFDTGWLLPEGTAEVPKLRVAEVAETEDGTILHFLQQAPSFGKGTHVHGVIDLERRRDHMQQHSGQHVLSAAFLRLFGMPTVSFHMGDESCSIDLETKSLSPEHLESAERLANDIVMEDRSVGIRFVSQEEARGLGLRKLPPGEKAELRLIDIHNFDLTACGGTHVRNTGQIGCILLRKTEKVKPGWRVEFVCGHRAVKTARRDYSTLAEASGLFSSHIWDVPQQIRKSQEESRAGRKGREQLLAELADLCAARLVAETAESQGNRIVVRVFPDRDLIFIKLLAQRLTRQAGNVIALLGATSAPPALVFAASPGLACDMGSLMKQALDQLGGRGGGSKDMAQGGPQKTEQIQDVLAQLQASLG